MKRHLPAHVYDKKGVLYFQRRGQKTTRMQHQPGTKEFRAALRDALEGVKNVAGAHGIFNMSAGDHLGLDNRARVMVQIENGAWKLAK